MESDTLEKSGLQINLDLGENNACIVFGVIKEDICMPCTELSIVFECDKKLVFTNDSQCYIRYKGIDWVGCVTKTSYTVNMTWHYECTLHPKSASELIKKPTKNTQDLAIAMKLKLLQDSYSLPIKFPVKNYYGFEIVKEYRFQSIKMAYANKNMGDAQILYFDSINLMSNTIKQIITKDAFSFIKNPETDVVEYIEDEMNIKYTTSVGAKHWTHHDYLTKMFGSKFEIDTPKALHFLGMYTMPSDIVPSMDSNKKYLCIYHELDVVNGATMKYILAEVKYVN